MVAAERARGSWWGLREIGEIGGCGDRKLVVAEAERDWGKSVAAEGDRGKLVGDIQKRSR